MHTIYQKKEEENRKKLNESLRIDRDKDRQNENTVQNT